MSAVFEGATDGGDTPESPLAREVADAIEAWLQESSPTVPAAIHELTAFVRRLSLDVPHEARDRLRFRWQGLGRAPIDKQLPTQCDRVLVVSPFVRPDSVSRILTRTRELRLVSTPECLDELDSASYDSIEQRRMAQGTPVLYQVNEHGDGDDVLIDGIHAKLVLAESRSESITLVGSANATGPGWGFAGPANVEAMAELSPGITIKAFVQEFLATKGKPHPWVSVYDRSARTDPDPNRELERRLLGALRDVGMLEYTLRYDETHRRLTLSGMLKPRGVSAPGNTQEDFVLDLAPLSLSEQQDVWQPLDGLAAGDLVFEDVALGDVTAFVSVRARNRSPLMEKTRVVLARLQMSAGELDRRDEIARQHLLADADPAAVLRALIRGVARLRSGNGPLGTAGGKHDGHTIQQLFADTGLERVLQAVAEDRTIVSDLRILVGPRGDPAFYLFCNDLDEACKTIDAECTP